MKKQFSNYNLLQFLETISDQFNETITQDCQEYKIEIPASIGKGMMYGYDFEDGLQAMLLDGQLNHDCEWRTEDSSPSPFMMFYIAKGNFLFEYTGLEKALTLKGPKAFFTTHPPAVKQQLTLNGKTPALLLLLYLKRQLYIDHLHCFSEEEKQVFSSMLTGKTQVKMIPQTPQSTTDAIDILHEILNNDKKGLTRSSFAKSKILELFSLQLEEWKSEIDDLPAAEEPQADNLELLNEVRAILLNDLKNAPTIETLSRKVGLNQQKLKRGFKLAFGKTINEFLREERLKAAREMLSQGNPTVRYVASAVGYDNASYFARRFQERYGVYPVDYLKMIRHKKAEVPQQVQDEEQ